MALSSNCCQCALLKENRHLMLQSKLPFFVVYFFLLGESAGKELVHLTRNWDLATSAYCEPWGIPWSLCGSRDLCWRPLVCARADVEAKQPELRAQTLLLPPAVDLGMPGEAFPSAWLQALRAAKLLFASVLGFGLPRASTMHRARWSKHPMPLGSARAPMALGSGERGNSGVAFQLN